MLRVEILFRPFSNVELVGVSHRIKKFDDWQALVQQTTLKHSENGASQLKNNTKNQIPYITCRFSREPNAHISGIEFSNKKSIVQSFGATSAV